MRKKELQELKKKRDEYKKKVVTLLYNNFELFDNLKISKLWNFCYVTNRITLNDENNKELIKCQINNYIILIDIINSKIKLNEKYEQELKSKIKKLEIQYLENLSFFNKIYDIFKTEEIVNKFDLESDTLYENYRYLNKHIKDRIEERNLIISVYSKLKKLESYLNYEEYNFMLKKIKRLLKYNDHELEFYLDYFEEVKKDKLDRLKKCDTESEVIKTKEGLCNLVKNNVDNYDEHYEKIINSDNTNKELVLFINKYANNFINNKLK